MDVLVRQQDQAQLHGLLAPLGTQPLRYRASLYANDAILFIMPKRSKMKNVSEWLQLFEQCLAHKLQ
jgi:hypothetical protein